MVKSTLQCWLDPGEPRADSPLGISQKLLGSIREEHEKIDMITAR